jgi:hypothetical protein
LTTTESNDAGPDGPVFLYVSDGWLSDGKRHDSVVLVMTGDDVFRYATHDEAELFYRLHGSNLM